MHSSKSICQKINREILLRKFSRVDHEISGRLINDMINQTAQFSIKTYQGYISIEFFGIAKYILELNENCYVNDWSFDNTFLFMGSVSTTIGYGHIVPKSRAGKSCCILFTVFSGTGLKFCFFSTSRQWFIIKPWRKFPCLPFSCSWFRITLMNFLFEQWCWSIIWWEDEF